MLPAIETPYEISPEQMGARDIAQNYLRIEENTEYLTHICKYSSGIKRQVFTLSTPQIDIKSFLNLMVQTSYLLYTCSIKKVALFLSQEHYLNFNKIEVVRQFIFEEQYLAMDERRRKDIDNKFMHINIFKYENAYAEYVLKFIESYLKTIKEYTEKHKDKKINADMVFKRSYENLFNAVRMLIPYISTLKPKLLISCLEETQVFRSYSYLLKILNNSIYQSIRKRGKLKQVLQETKHRQIMLNKRHSLMYNDNSIEREDKFFESSIDDFLKFLIRQNVIEIQLSVTTGHNSKNQQSKIGFIEQTKTERITTWKIKIQEKKFREFTKELVLELDSSDPRPQSSIPGENTSKLNLFVLEYHAKKNLIIVKYVTEIEVNLENNDALMYHCNNMMFEWNNISIDQVEREKSNKRKEKYIALKVISCFNIKDSPFVNILLMIDMAMIYGKVLEPELARDIIRFEDFNRFTLAGRKINHLMKLFITKIRTKYETIGMKNY